MSVVIAGVLVGSIFTSFSLANDTVTADQNVKRQAKIKNVIFLIGDGMGPAYNTAYRYLQDDPSTPYMENTAFDEHFVGMQKLIHGIMKKVLQTRLQQLHHFLQELKHTTGLLQ